MIIRKLNLDFVILEQGMLQGGLLVNLNTVNHHAVFAL